MPSESTPRAVSCQIVGRCTRYILAFLQGYERKATNNCFTGRYCSQKPEPSSPKKLSMPPLIDKRNTDVL
ncbi:hypothetical protein Y032_0162g3411 [Ancylostoma ceylanicum]|uniref:Uncharacterized protein n=1 Tax=Ancylostoma ceylanicum TaxID=53326 RepID=A0A016SY06_9BILA|nr:hypothetical protein Y032_0162g3411 [Ancylostoma ceylanicum]